MFRYKQQTKVTNEPAKLPSTRKELFWDIVKNDFSLVVNVSLLCLLVSLPLLVVLVVQYMLLTSLQQPTVAKIFPVVLYSNLVSIPLWGLRYVGRNGAFAVMTKRAYNQGCFVAETFWQGIKEGFGKAFLLGVIVGASFVIATAGSIYVVYSTTNSIARGFGIGICLLQFAVFFCCAEYFCLQNNIYQLRFADLLHNGLSFSVIKFGQTVLFVAIFALLPFALCCVSAWVAIAVIGVYSVVADGLSVVASTICGLTTLDKYINESNYPELVGKGLNKDKE